MLSFRKLAGLVAGLFVSALGIVPAAAQDYPNR
jgi:hypothetical protein